MIFVNLLLALLFETTVVDLGSLKETDSVQQATYVLTNNTQQAVRIDRITTSCGCTVAQAPKEAIAAGEKGEIRLAFNPHNQIGDVEIEAQVYVADTLATKLLLRAHVDEVGLYSHYRVQMGALRLRTDQVTYQNRGPQVERIAVGNTSDQPLTISARQLPEGVTLTTEPSVIPARGEADLVIRMDNRQRTDQQIIPLEGVDGTLTIRIQQ